MVKLADENTAGKGYDIKNLYMCADSKFLYVAADYYSTPADDNSYIHTLRVRDKKREFNWWIQGSETGLYGIRTFKDGTAYENWQNADMPEITESIVKKHGEWKIPMSVFGNTSDLQVLYSSKPHRVLFSKYSTDQK